MFYDLGINRSRVMSRTKLMKIGPTRRCNTSRRGGRKTRKNVTVKLVRPVKNGKTDESSYKSITAERLNPAKMPPIGKEEFKTYCHGIISYPGLYYELANYHALLVLSGQCVTTAILVQKAKEIAQCLGIDVKKITKSWLHYFLNCCANLRKNTPQINPLTEFFNGAEKCTLKSPQLVEQTEFIIQETPNRCKTRSPEKKEECPENENALFSLFAGTPVETEKKSTEIEEPPDLINLFSASPPSVWTADITNNIRDVDNIQNNRPVLLARKPRRLRKDTSKKRREALDCGIYLKLRMTKAKEGKRKSGWVRVSDSQRQKRCLHYLDPVFEFPQLLPQDSKAVRVKTPPPIPPTNISEDVFSDLFNAVQSFPL